MIDRASSKLSSPHDSPLSADGLDQSAIRKAKEELLSRGLLDAATLRSGVRDVIDRSWRRCIGEAVPTNHTSVPGRSNTPDSVLQEAAEPVLVRLAEHLADVRVALYLSDSQGNILTRKASERRQRILLDNAYAAEGFDFSERAIGTNGLGTSLAERRPLLIRGNEHFSESLAPFTCSGAPIFEPFTGHLLGVFSIAANTEDASSLMAAITVDVGRQIEANLAALLRTRDESLVQTYLSANRNKLDQVIVINERTMLANTAALSHLTPDAHATLWCHLEESGPSRGVVRMSIPLQSMWHDAEVEAVASNSSNMPTYMIRVLPSDTRQVANHARVGAGWREAPNSSNAIHPVPMVVEQLAVVARHREPLAVLGASGTGKLHVARAFLRNHFCAESPAVIDVSTQVSMAGKQWFVESLDALASGHPLILHHLQDLPVSQVNRVKAIVRASKPDAPVVITADLSDAPNHVIRLLGQLATSVELPELRDLPEHIPTLISAIIAELPPAERGTRLSSEAQQLLIRWEWPGNLAELRKTVEQLAHRMPGKLLQPMDLPGHLQGARSQRRLSMIESAERVTIVRALQQHSGNRSKAAEALGIGRSTLYRKMQSHRIEV